MSSPLNAQTSTAGSLLSSSAFQIPPFQREYSWGKDEVLELCQDLQNSLKNDSYFLGLVILVQRDSAMLVVDGQQRLITLSLIAIALQREARRFGRDALSRSIESTFLKFIDYETDASKSRLIFTDEQDELAYAQLLEATDHNSTSEDQPSEMLLNAFGQVQKFIKSDIKADPFKRLGRWAEFLTNNLYFATFVHPDSNSAYQVFEVINTRGKDLTTADLLKNYLLSQVAPEQQKTIYKRWQLVAKSFQVEGSNAFVQYIRHVVTLESGHVLPKYLYGFLASRSETSQRSSTDREPPAPMQLLAKLEEHLDVYLQMIEPIKSDTVSVEALRIFQALNDLNVIAVRPILLALHRLEDGHEGMYAILKLVVKRVVVGSLGTGNVERRFSEAAHRIAVSGEWRRPLNDLKDLEPTRSDFIEQVRKRQYSNRVLEFLARSLKQQSVTPTSSERLNFISVNLGNNGFTEPDAMYWERTIGNTILLPDESDLQGEDWKKEIENLGLFEGNAEGLNEQLWNASAVERRGEKSAQTLANFWYS